MDLRSKGSFTKDIDNLGVDDFSEQAAASLIERLFPIARNQALQFLSKSDAESIARGTASLFITQTKNGKYKFTNRFQLLALFTTIAKNRSIDRYRKKKREHLQIDLMSDNDDSAIDDSLIECLKEGDPSPETIASCNELEKRFFDLLGQQPQEVQEVFKLKYRKDLAIREIALAIKKSPATVSRILRRIDDLLQRLLEDDA